MSAAPYRKVPSAGLKSWLPPMLISGFLWWTSPNVVTQRQWVMAAALLVIPWVAYYRWQRRPGTRLPLFAIIALAYWAAFAMPLFLAEPPTDPTFGMTFSEATIYDVMVMAVLGVAALGLGMKVPFRPLNPSLMPDIVETPQTWKYLYCVLALGGLLSFRMEYTSALGGGGRQVLVLLASSVPLAICAMLTFRYADGVATPSNRKTLFIFISARLVIGIASGWLGSVVTLFMIVGLVYTSKRRQLPALTLAIVIPIILFLQPGKTVFRDAYWRGGKTGSMIEKAEFWLNASWTQWSHAFRAGDRYSDHKDRRALFSQTIDRVALLPQAANVLSKSPRLVPFQNGASYTYLAATLIPRAVWPDKPSVNDANRAYQVAYGLTSKDDLEGVSISVGCLTEAYMNFGWRGVVPIMFFIGVLVGLFERTLLGWDSGLLFCGTGMALLFTLISVEAQAAQYLGGLLQQIALLFMVALPVIRRRRKRHPQTAHLQGAM